MTEKDTVQQYEGPAGGWGSLQGILRIAGSEVPEPGVIDTLMHQNKSGGHMCTSCAWAKPAVPHAFEFCENGAKATIWDLTLDRCTPQFFAEHTVSELLSWSDHDLEDVGRLTAPMRYDPSSDRYVACTWEEAFNAIGSTLKRLQPESVVFYTSGRASLETSYLYALFARLYGNNNLPDSSNMCHETTSVALTKVIGASVGTCVLEDFDKCDMLLFFGQNTGSNSPRFLHPLQDAAERGCTIVTFNPVCETGLIKFTNPQDPIEMLTGSTTRISDIYLQVHPGGDIAALTGLCKYVIEAADKGQGYLHDEFIAMHTSGFERFAAFARNVTWQDIETESGLSQQRLSEVGELYLRAQRVIGIYGMGLTQHVHGFENIAMLVNLLLLRGNIGREGAGIAPVRGHSNVQGQRTVGIADKPELVPLDRLAEIFKFTPPRTKGRTTVEAIEGLLDGSVKGFVSLGGNFARAIPDHYCTEQAWKSLELNVQVATKLNRSHLLVSQQSWLLPCLVRSEEDVQATGPQVVTMEDSLSHIHASSGRRTPASSQLKSEISIVAGLAKAAIDRGRDLPWDAWTGDYGLVRDLIEQTYPDQFKDFNQRLHTPGGFYRGNKARERHWATDDGKAHFTTPNVLSALGRKLEAGEYTLLTLRSNDQFNTTIYGLSDRLRGIEGKRDILMMAPQAIHSLGLEPGARVTVECAIDDSVTRRLSGLELVAYELPDSCVAAYYPEINGLIPRTCYDLESKTPAYKGVPVRVYRSEPASGQVG